MAFGLWQRLWLTRLSRPAGERLLHRHVLQARPARILEVGLGTLVRTERLLRALNGTIADPVRYVGVDRFEGRGTSDPPGVSLKEAHRRLHSLARVQLVPGNVDTALARVCNHLGTFDLAIISADNEGRQLERAWFFLRRLITPTTSVYVEAAEAGGPWHAATLEQVDAWAARTVQAGSRRAG